MAAAARPRILPRHRPRQRPVELEHARPVAVTGAAAARTRRAAGHRRRRGPAGASGRAGSRPRAGYPRGPAPGVRYSATPPSDTSRATSGAGQPREPAADHRPADLVRERREQQPVAAGDRLCAGRASSARPSRPAPRVPAHRRRWRAPAWSRAARRARRTWPARKRRARHGQRRQQRVDEAELAARRRAHASPARRVASLAEPRPAAVSAMSLCTSTASWPSSGCAACTCGNDHSTGRSRSRNAAEARASGRTVAHMSWVNPSRVSGRAAQPAAELFARLRAAAPGAPPRPA